MNAWQIMSDHAEWKAWHNTADNCDNAILNVTDFADWRESEVLRENTLTSWWESEVLNEGILSAEDFMAEAMKGSRRIKSQK